MMGIPEFLIFVAIVLIIFGPGRIARLGSEIRQFIRNFRKTSDSR
jgi:Sec-independent protein translocase protein TatA